MPDPAKKYETFALDYEQIFDLADVFFVVLNKKGQVVLANKQTCSLLGYNEQEIVGKDWFKNYLPKRAVKEARTAFGDLMEKNQLAAQYFEHPVINKQGEERVIRWHNKVIRDKAGAFFCLSVGRDSSDYKRAEAEMKRLAEFNQKIIDDSPLGIFLIDQQGRIEYANRAMLEISGTPKEKLIGFDAMHSPTYKEIGLDKKMEEAIKTKKEFKTELVKYKSFFAEKETYRIFYGIPIFDIQGRFEKLVLTVKDETELMQAHEELTRFNRLMVGRELKMIELKKEIKRLKGLKIK